MLTYLPRLSAAQILTHVQQTHHLWGADTTIENRGRLLINRIDAHGPEGLFLSGLIDRAGTLVASLKRYHFDLVLDRKPRKCVGIGAVFTHQLHRKQGHAETLLRQVLDESHSQYDREASLLFSDIDPKYYERFGFRALPSKNWQTTVGALPQDKPLGLRLATTADTNTLQQWREQTLASYALYLKHTPQSWALFRAINNVEQDMILTDGGEDVGYVALNHNEKEHYLWINECFLLPSLATRLWATLAEHGAKTCVTGLRGWCNDAALVPPQALVVNRTQAIPMVAALGSATALTETNLQKSALSSPDHF